MQFWDKKFLYVAKFRRKRLTRKGKKTEGNKNYFVRTCNFYNPLNPSQHCDTVLLLCKLRLFHFLYFNSFICNSNERYRFERSLNCLFIQINSTIDFFSFFFIPRRIKYRSNNRSSVSKIQEYSSSFVRSFEREPGITFRPRSNLIFKRIKGC